MTANSEIQDATIRHSILMTQVGNGTANKMLALLNRSEAELVATMRALDPDDVSSRFKQARIERMLADIREQQLELKKRFKKDLRSETSAIAVNEREFQGKMIVQSAGEAVAGDFDFVSPARVKAAATSRPFQSVHLKWATEGDHVDELFRRRIGLVQDEIRRGFVEGESIPTMINRIRGTRAQGFRDGILEINRRSADTMVRTAVTHTSNAARQEVYTESEDLLQGVRYIAILDGRTTLICAGLDGKIFPVTSGPRPPQHPGCRSSTAPVLADEPIPDYKSYNDWLKTQDKAFVEEVLGKKKAQLYLKGELTLDKFTKGTTILTLDQLRVKEDQAWKKAGLSGTKTTKPAPPKAVKKLVQDPLTYQPAEKLEDAISYSESQLGLSVIDVAQKAEPPKSFRRPAPAKKTRLDVLNTVLPEAQRLKALSGRDDFFDNVKFIPNTAKQGRAHVQRIEQKAAGRFNYVQTNFKWPEKSWENELKWRKIRKEKGEPGVSYGWTGPATEDVRAYTFRHEIGHVLTSSAIYQKAPALLVEAFGPGAPRHLVQKSLSRYAGKNLWETLAELFAIVHGPTYVRGTLSKGLEDLADEMLKKG